MYAINIQKRTTYLCLHKTFSSVGLSRTVYLIMQTIMWRQVHSHSNCINYEQDTCTLYLLKVTKKKSSDHSKIVKSGVTYPGFWRCRISCEKLGTHTQEMWSSVTEDVSSPLEMYIPHKKCRVSYGRRSISKIWDMWHSW